MIKLVLYWAPQRAKFLAYKSLCMPHLEYAAAWNPSSEGKMCNPKMVLIQAVRFVAGTKSSREQSEAMKKLEIRPPPTEETATVDETTDENSQ